MLRTCHKSGQRKKTKAVQGSDQSILVLIQCVAASLHLFYLYYVLFWFLFLFFVAFASILLSLSFLLNFFHFFRMLTINVVMVPRGVA